MGPGLRRVLLGALLGLLATHGSRAGDAEQFNDYLKYTQDVIARQHLIVYAKIEFDDSKKKEIEFRYDHYPEIERMQLPDGATYARKKDKAWLKSDDWAETGKPAPKKLAQDFENWIGLANAPLLNIHEERDQSQGGVVPTLLNDEGEDEKEVVFELRREHSTGILYPRFGFSVFGEKALLHSYNGAMHYGPDHVMAHFRYDFMFQVKMTEATPAPKPDLTSPSPAASLSPAAGGLKVTRMEQASSAGAEELLKAACKKMERGSWKVNATLTYKKTLGLHGLINGKDFDLTTEPHDGSKPMRQVTIVTISWVSKDGGKTWNKADARDRAIYNWVHSPLLGNEDMPAFESVGTEKQGAETWQHLRLKVEEKVDDETKRPHYWIAVDEQGNPLGIRRFEGPVIIQGQVMQEKADYAPSKEPFITPPMMKH